MTRLRSPRGDIVVLTPYCLAGRSPKAHVRLSSSAASSEHAAFHFAGGTWYLRDLGSKNGTYLNGAPVDQRKRAPLARGDTVHFGEARERWRFEPDESVTSGGQETIVETDSLHPRTGLDRIVLELAMSPDEKDVTVAFFIPEEQHRAHLGTRSAFHLLLFLARRRLEDRARGVARAEEGWRPREVILEALGVTKNRLSVETHRLRQLFETHGVRDGASIIELRRASGSVRLGIERIEIG